MSEHTSPSGGPLPVHGFVLAGGRSTRMGRDKALLELRGRPMIELAVAKLRAFCAQVSIVGDRPDLERFAPIVRDERPHAGPAAGVEAGLRACRQPWAMFVPVDAPLVPAELLQRFASVASDSPFAATYLHATEVLPEAGPPPSLASVGISLEDSRLIGIGRMHFTFCVLRRDALDDVARALSEGERRLQNVLDRAGGAPAYMMDMFDLYRSDPYTGPDAATVRRWFSNVNSPADLALAERASGHDKPAE